VCGIRSKKKIRLFITFIVQADTFNPHGPSLFKGYLMGWSASIGSIIFLIYFILTMPYFHWTVLLEEEFLANKYGNSYREYVRSSSRYCGVPKTERIL